VVERTLREVRRRKRVVGAFPDGNSALMRVCARLRHTANTKWGNLSASTCRARGAFRCTAQAGRKYLNMDLPKEAYTDEQVAI